MLVVLAPMILAQALMASSPHPLEEQLYLVDQDRFIDRVQLEEMMMAHPHVILGEIHDNPQHHQLQAWAVERIIAKGGRPLVAFEMIDQSQRPALEKSLQQAPKDGTALGQALAWDKSGWPDWEMYRPIAQIALDADLPLAPANLSRAHIQTLMSEQRNAPLITDQDRAMAQDIRDGHCGMLPESAVPAMVAVQKARDEAMAAALRQSPQTVLIAGAGHARHDTGAASRLPPAQVLSVAFVEVKENATDPKSYAQAYGTEKLPFDVVWFTRPQDRADPCQALRERFGTGKQP